MKLLSFLLAACLASGSQGFSINNNAVSSSKLNVPSVIGTSSALFSSASSSSAVTSKSDESDEYDLSLFSPCKVNLFLRIIRKREDGFHDLASLFQAVGFGDTLHLSLVDDAEEDTFECNMEGVPTDKTNLVIRALDLVREKTGNTDKFFKSNLIKQVPAQAGLGGGSANAAAAMWGANELLGSPASLEEVSVERNMLYFTFNPSHRFIYSFICIYYTHFVHCKFANVWMTE